jgi:transposase
MGDVRNNLAFKKSVQVLLLAQSEKSQRTIAYRFDSNQSIVSKLLRRRRETGRHIRRPGQSRKRITTPHQDQYLRLISIREGFLTALLFFKIACHVRQYALRLSENTVGKRLKEDRIHPRRPATGPKLTAALRRNCLNFALEHVNWVEQDWGRVLVFDESKFCLYESDGQVIMYRRPGEQYVQCNFVTKESFGGYL